MRGHWRLCWLAIATLAIGSVGALPTSAQPQSKLDQVLDTIIARERSVAARLSMHRPLVETYLQTVKGDSANGGNPLRDHYFLGRLDLSGPTQEDGKKKKRRNRSKGKLLNLFNESYAAGFKPEGFARMLVLDQEAFDREHYDFDFVRRDFLGEIRTLVFDVMPKKGIPMNGPASGRFSGRIWVEEEEFFIVRYNGVYGTVMGGNLHFDSWRLNMEQGLWLPAYVYTEETEMLSRQLEQKHKGQTRIWGYMVGNSNAEEEFAKIMIDPAMSNDTTETPGEISPVKAIRAWEREAEDNVLRRLERSGILAPDGEVNQILETVVANLEVTNDLVIEPPVRCRVLMTTPLEHFSIGHTIVLSRGLIDVLPDEASLAMVLAQELGHIVSGHRLDTKYAFSDEMLIGDRQALASFNFDRDPAEIAEADAKAMTFLSNSPYKDGLKNAGLFLKALRANAEALPALIRPHFGSHIAKGDQVFRMGALLEAAPDLDPASMEQVAALPLGGRVKVNPWNAEVELMKSNRVALMSAREKLPFQVTPLMPYLVRFGNQPSPTAQEGSSDQSSKLPTSNDNVVPASARDSAKPGVVAAEERGQNQ